MSANPCKEFLPVCKAQCCYNVPLPRWKYDEYKHKTVRKVYLINKLRGTNNQIVPVTVKKKPHSACPFLREDLRCNIHKNRPHTCKLYGSGESDDPRLHCTFLQDIKMIPVKSSTVAEVGYDKKAKVLKIKFIRGAQYEYYDVPEETHNDLVNADSVGSYLNKNIAKKFKFKKL